MLYKEKSRNLNTVQIEKFKNKDINELLMLLNERSEFKFEILWEIILKNNLSKNQLISLWKEIDFFYSEEKDKSLYFTLLNKLYENNQKEVIERIKKIPIEEIEKYGKNLLNLLADNKNLNREIVKKILLSQKYLDIYVFYDIFYNYPYMLLKYLKVNSEDILKTEMTGIKEIYQEIFNKNKIKFLYKLYKSKNIFLLEIFEKLIKDFEFSQKEIEILKISIIEKLNFLSKIMGYFTRKKLMVTSVFFNLMEILKDENIYMLFLKQYFWLYLFNYRSLEEVLKKYIEYNFCGEEINKLLFENQKYLEIERKNYSLKELRGDIELREYYNSKLSEWQDNIYKEIEKKSIFFQLSDKVQVRNNEVYFYRENEFLQKMPMGKIGSSIEIPFVEGILDEIGFLKLKNELFFIEWELKFNK